MTVGSRMLAAGTARNAASAGLALVIALALPAAADGAGKKPDLVVTAVTSPPPEAYIGESLPVELTIQNKGKKASKASKAGVGLATTTSLTTPPDIELPALDTPAIKPKKKKTVTGTVPVASDQEPAGPLYLLTCADRTNVVKESKETNNCRSSTGQTELKRAPTTFELIDAEYTAGQISLGQALLYKTYAEAGDPRLPERFGDPPEDAFDTGTVVKQAASQFASLPEADQMALEPFFRPPTYDGAVFPGEGGAKRKAGPAKRAFVPPCADGGEAPQLSAGWDSLTTTHFRIHYYTSKPYESAPEPARSLEVAQQIQAVAEDVYTKEIPIFGTPLSDAAQPCNGGDALIDVYVVRMSNSKIAQVRPYLPGGEARPAWMYVAPDEVTDAINVRDVFAHEFAHVAQFRNDYFINPSPTGLNLEYGWLEEATATWAINHVYPSDNYEWRFNPKYFDLGAWHVPLGEANDIRDENGYRDWLFFLFQTKDSGSTAAITNTFTASQSMGSVEALNQGLGGNLPTRFKDFALELMNREDRNGFVTWDGITDKLPMGSAVSRGDQTLSLSLGGLQTRELPLPQTNTIILSYDANVSVDGKSFAYTSFQLPDANVKNLTFKKYGWRGGADSGARITAWFKTANGQYHEENWSDGADQEFCRDNPDENITELVLFYTNASPKPYLSSGNSLERPVYQQGKVELKDACDPVPYDVTFSGVSRRQAPHSGVIDYTTQFEGTMRLVPTTGFTTSWSIEDGTLVVDSVSGDAGNCTISSSGGTFDLPSTEQTAAPVMFGGGGANPTYFVNTPWVINNPPYQIGVTLDDGAGLACDEEEHESPLYGYGQWITRTPTPLAPQANGNLHGTFHVTEDPEWTHDFEFTLVPDYD